MDVTEQIFKELDPISVETLNVEELVSDGEYKLLHGQFSEGLEAFNTVEELLEDSQPILYFRMGLSLFEWGSEEGHEHALLLASRKFKMAHKLSPYVPETLQAWGNTLVQLGERFEEHHYFISAKEKYEIALGLGEESTDLFWDYAVSWYHIGVNSGEAYDLQKAIQYFERAALEGQVMSAEFWIDYGASALLLSTKINDNRQVVKAVNCFKQSASIDKSNLDAWYCLAEALESLYDHTHDDDHFSQTNDAYATAINLSPQEVDIWLRWAQFLLKSARRSGDLKRLRASLEKCHHAYACDGEIPMILATWAEALALLGELTERLDLIYEAENKMAEALEFDEEDPALWLSLGNCMSSFANYFNDYDHHYLAIEKFQTGLSIDRSNVPLWHSMATSYAAVGELEENTDLIIQSLKFFEKSLKLLESSTLHVDYAKALSKLGEMTHEEGWLQQALYHFEMAFAIQKNAVYLHPEWLFTYATTLDMMGDFHEDEKYYTKAIEIFSHVIMVDPDFPSVHHNLAQALSHFGELTYEIDYFYRAIHHLRLALKHDEENDSIILDWGIALINLAEHSPILTDSEQLMHDANQKLMLAAKLGNVGAYYQISCLFSLQRQYTQSLYFLKKAGQYGALPPLDELMSDDWLDNLRSTVEFREFVAHHPNLQE